MTVDQDTLAVIDQAVLALFQGLAKDATGGAATSVQKILDVSASFLSKDAHGALQSFHNLYFGAAQVEAQKVNDDVDRMFEEAQAALSNGKDLDQAVTDSAESARLGLSALQKKLESVVATRQSLRDKLTPILSGMQFEDAMSQRVAHLTAGWEMTVMALVEGKIDADGIARKIAASLTSDSEREQFYRLVLREEAPAGSGDTGIWLDFSA